MTYRRHLCHLSPKTKVLFFLTDFSSYRYSVNLTCSPNFGLRDYVRILAESRSDKKEDRVEAVKGFRGIDDHLYPPVGGNRHTSLGVIGQLLEKRGLPERKFVHIKLGFVCKALDI